jgi:hypothetical protein
VIEGFASFGFSSDVTEMWTGNLSLFHSNDVIFRGRHGLPPFLMTWI